MELRKLASIANKLDSLGLTKEADVLDRYIRKVAEAPRYNLPDADLESLPESPEEVAAMKAKSVQPMMQNQTYGEGATSMRGVTNRPEDMVGTRYEVDNTLPAFQSTQMPSTQKDIKIREQLSQALSGNKKIYTPAEIKQDFGFSFDPTMGKAGNIAKIQSGLVSCGFKPGKIDGYWGMNTDLAFREAIHAFIILAPEEATMENINEMAVAIEQGRPSALQFSLEHVLNMFEIIKRYKDRGNTVSGGRAITNYDGSKGGGLFQQKNLRDDATLSSTRAGTPVSGTAKKY